MRDLLDKIHELNESRGLSARQPGEEFVRTGSTDPNDVIRFDGLDFYPESGSFESTQAMMDALGQVEDELGNQVHQINQPTGRARAFAVAKFTTAFGPRYLVKFAQDIKPVRTQNTFFQTSDIPGGFTYKTAKAQKETVGYKPSQVLTEFKSQTPESIIKQIQAKFGTNSAEYQAASIFAASDSFPILVPAGNMDFAGFRDYFCEMLQPIALIKGMPVTGNAKEAAGLFLGENGYSDCVVSFNTSVSGGLYDSLLVNPEGKQIKLSSKGAKGAMASSVNLLKSAEELEQAGMTEFKENYADVLDILNTIAKSDHNQGPLKLAVQIKMITPAEAQQVLQMKQYDGKKDFDIEATDLTDNLKEIYRERKADDPKKIVPINHMVASIAYKVCNDINMNTNFSEAAADILNNSAFVQMYTIAKKAKDHFSIEGFKTVWPSKIFTQVTLEAGKSYSSTTSSSGRLVFNINTEPKVQPNVDHSAKTGDVETGQPGEITDYIPQRSGIKASDPGLGRDRRPPESEISALGRRRRKTA